MVTKRQTFGQYDTPASVADLILGFCLRSHQDSVLDPSCGSGAFLSRAEQFLNWLSPKSEPAGKLWGIEVDIERAAQAQIALNDAQIISRDFFELEPDSVTCFDAVVGNPPYTRSEWIRSSHVRRDQSEQLSIFKGSKKESIAESGSSIQDLRDYRKERSNFLSKRAGLHAYFFIHVLNFLKQGGRLGFVVPNSWLDVAYGERLKRFLLEHYNIVAIIESKVERWFKQARINTCIVILERNSDPVSRLDNRVHLVRLDRHLDELITYGLDDKRRLDQVKEIIAAILTSPSTGKGFSKRIINQQDLISKEKWGLVIRAPDIFRRSLIQTRLQPLRNWAKIRRGFTTGSNEFFYLDNDGLSQWPIETHFRRPLLKSLRQVAKRRVEISDCELQVLVIKNSDDIVGTVAGEYVNWGEKNEFHLRATCASRDRWYSLPIQKHAPILLPKGIWGRHFAPFANEGLCVDQQIYQVYLVQGVRPEVAAALLNSAWFGLQLELQGRINFGEGVLWLAQYEIEQALLPDPRYLADRVLEELASKMNLLSTIEVHSTAIDAQLSEWQELNEVVFDTLEFSSRERKEVIDSLLESVGSRQMKARTNPRTKKHSPS